MEGSSMEEKNEVVDQNNNKLDEIMLPGFRFHPTDEELVGFYLKRKIQQQPLSIELIKQLDIYKFDPWDLPKFASNAGEKEWYFYCPRDRKYRNSARPNRVTGAGFWKATGTDRPIYSSEGNKCIGLKKSLVFYKGRAAKGVKTDWMMHEFRLPSLNDSIPSSRCVDRNLPAHDSWAICRIFKKTIPITPRTLSHSWVSPSLPTTPPSNHTLHINPSPTTTNSPFTPESVTKTVSTSQSNSTNNEFDNILHSPNTTFSSFLDIPTFKSPIYTPTTTTLLDLPPSYILPQLEEPSPESSKSSNIDIPSMLLNMSSTVLDTSFNNHNKYCDRNTEFCNVGHHGSHDFPLGYREFANDGEMNNYQNYQSALMENLSNLVHGDHVNDYHPYFDGVEAIGSIPIAGLLPLEAAWKSSSQSLLWDCAPLS